MRAMFKAMFLAWIRMWRDMFKFFPPNSIGRKDFALTMAMNLIMVGVFMAFCLGFYEDFIIMLGNFFLVALTSLLVRRLRDAGFSFGGVCLLVISAMMIEQLLPL